MVSNRGAGPQVAASQPAVARAASGRPVATINGQAIERKEFVDLLIRARGLTLLQQLMLREAAAQEARRVGAGISESEIEREYDLALQVEGINAKEPEKLTPTRREQMISEWTTSRGVSREELRIAMERQAYLRKIVEGQIAITEETLRKEYARTYGEKVEVRHLQLAAPRFFPQIKARLDKGERFEDLVTQFSQNSLTKEHGGMLPPFTADDDSVPAVFAKTAFALKAGEYSNPVVSEGSYHVLKLERRIAAESTSFDQAKDMLRNRLAARQAMQAMQDLSARLLTQTELRIEDPELREQYRAQRAAGQIHGPALGGQ